MRMRIKPLGQFHRGVEPEVSIIHKTLRPKFQTGVDQFDVAFLQREIHDPLVFFRQNRAGRVHDVSPARGIRVYRIDSRQNQLPLEVVTPLDVLLVFARFHALVFRDHAGSGTGRVQQHSVEALHDVAELPSVDGSDDRIHDAHAVKIADDGFNAIFVDVVGEQDAGVFHDGGDVRGFAARRGGHVQDALVFLRGEGHHREQTGRALDYVVAR